MEKEIKDRPTENDGQTELQKKQMPTRVGVEVWLGVVFIIGCFYFQLFWLLFLAGVGLTIRYWKHRQSGDEKNGLCFFGVILTLTGIIAMIIQYCLAQD